MVDAILDPTGGTRAKEASTVLTPRRARLAGATIGLLENTEQNAALFLDELGKLLRERHGVAATVARTKTNFAMPVGDELMRESADTRATGRSTSRWCSPRGRR